MTIARDIRPSRLTAFSSLFSKSPALYLVVAAIGIGAAVVQPGTMRVALLISLLVAVVGLGSVSAEGLLYALAIWLVAMGLIRRLVDTSASTSLGGLGDPLLLVGPAVLVALTAVAARKGAFSGRTPLTNAVLLLCGLSLIEVVNPLQGSPLVGLAGLLFLLVPMLAFFVGRRLVSDDFVRRLMVLIVILAVLAACYGFYQQDVGLPSWDAAWVASSGYAALLVDQTVRAFGPFSSSAEYGKFLGIGLVICLAGLTRARSFVVCAAITVLLGVALFYESSRGIIIFAALTAGILYAARHRARPLAALGLGLLGIIAVFLAAHSAVGSVADASGLSRHQVLGLANPFNAQDSTLSVHFKLVESDLKATLFHPFGHGTGSISQAATTFGGSKASSGIDLSTYGYALGWLGLIGYIVVAWQGLGMAYRSALANRSWWMLATLGVIVITSLQWADGGLYSVAWLPWLLLGWMEGRGEIDGHSQDETLRESQGVLTQDAWGGHGRLS